MPLKEKVTEERQMLELPLGQRILNIISNSRPNRKGGFCCRPDCGEGCAQVVEEIIRLVEAEILNELWRPASDKSYEDLFGDV